MHESIQALLELYDIDRQRLILKKERSRRDNSMNDAQGERDQASATASDAAQRVHDYDALESQSRADIERCEKEIEDLRAQQASAKTNKEYMGIINGIEEAKNTITMAKEKLAEVEAVIDEVKSEADALAQKRDEVTAATAAAIDENNDGGTAEISESELDRMYSEFRPKVDSKFLETYERLTAAKHPMPMMAVNASTRATAHGSLISYNQMEQIRMGQLVCDQTNNAILYIQE